MRNTRGRLLVGLAAIAVLALAISNVPLKAQSVGLIVKVPFEFHAGDATLPAGTYIVNRQGDAIRLRDGNGHSAAVIATAIPNLSNGANELSFNHYDGRYFLTAVRWNGYSTASGLPKSQTELKFAKTSVPEIVKIAALIR